MKNEIIKSENEQKFDETAYKALVKFNTSEIIGFVANIEIQISIFLSLCIVKGKEIDLIMYLLNKVNMPSKIVALKDVLDENTHLKNLCHKSFLNEIKSLQSRRNALAHSTLYTHGIIDFSKEKSMKFVNSNTLRRVYYQYSFVDFERDKEKIIKVGDCLTKLISEVIVKE